MLLPPKPSLKKLKPQVKRGIRIVSESPSESSKHSRRTSDGLVHSRPDGIEPTSDEQMGIDDWEKQTGRILSDIDVDEVAGLVTWCFVS